MSRIKGDYFIRIIPQDKYSYMPPNCISAWIIFLLTILALSENSDNEELEQHILPIFGDMLISDIKAEDIENYLQSLENDGVRMDGKPGGYSAQSIVHHYTVLNLMFNFAIKERIIKENPCNKEMKPTVITEEARYFDDKVMEKLFSKLDDEYKNGMKKWDWSPHYYDGQEVDCRPNEIQLEAVKKLVYHMHKIFIRLAFSTTSRRCAMCGLEFGDMDYNKNEIRFQRTSHYSKQKGIYTQTKPLKNKRHNRPIRMPVKYMQEIREYYQVIQATRKLMGDLWVDSDRLFIAVSGGTVSKAGGAINPSNISGWFRRFLKHNGFEHMPLYGLRHSGISYMINQGETADIVADRAGNTAAMIEERYKHIFDETKQRGADYFDKF